MAITETKIDLKSIIRNIPDFPKPGVVFRDITTLLQDRDALRYCVEQVAEHYRGQPIDYVAASESRGFIFGSAIAYYLHCGFIPIRKPNKLPAATLRESYKLEYGTDALEIHRDAIKPSDKVLLVDDLLATGGTGLASTRLIERLGGKLIGIAFIIELDFLKGRDKLKNYPIFSLVHYDQE